MASFSQARFSAGLEVATPPLVAVLSMFSFRPTETDRELSLLGTTMTATSEREKADWKQLKLLNSKSFYNTPSTAGYCKRNHLSSVTFSKTIAKDEYVTDNNNALQHLLKLV